MTTPKRNKLNALYTRLRPGAPVTSEDLATLRISADLAVHYVRAGWLTRLARGVYRRPNDTLVLEPCLVLLQRRLEGLHVGGKTALDWHGVRQYVARQPTLQLYGWQSGHLPAWFSDRFPAEYHRKRLFDEKPDALRHAAPFADGSEAPRVSAPERALLEMLSEVGVRQSLQEAREPECCKSCWNTARASRPCGCVFSWGERVNYPGQPSSIPPGCPPAATGPGYPVPATACWCSSHEVRGVK
jgi:hypothetical protein